ncbi:helix-turn-helix transcriptional regulator [Paenibacillus lycopersici]|uniref:Helix-turn-helix transcriptional regulator n=2 Tax=Paenibacillus lycopersici TaxID=2704462 RepID=A0A6C0G4N1_9BACL|nr:helix-turn-helix transcriptional regulator [Paenibacillus lycopersici]
MLMERLKQRRKAMHYTQEQLAELVNAKKTTISNYETGYSSPNNEMLRDLADVLHTTVDYLLGRSDNPVSLEAAGAQAIPDFATRKDVKDFKTFLNQQEVMFDGVPLTAEEKARVLGYMESMFWDAKRMNKRPKRDSES